MRLLRGGEEGKLGGNRLKYNCFHNYASVVVGHFPVKVCTVRAVGLEPSELNNDDIAVIANTRSAHVYTREIQRHAADNNNTRSGTRRGKAREMDGGGRTFGAEREKAIFRGTS